MEYGDEVGIRRAYYPDQDLTVNSVEWVLDIKMSLAFVDR